MTESPGRRLYLAAYCALAVAGAAAVAWPSPAVAQSGGRPWAGVWAFLLILGGGSSAIGILRDRYHWEYAGLLPLISVWLVYGLASFSLVALGSLDRVAGGFALLAVAALLAARWRYTAVMRRVSREVSKHGSNDRE